MKRWLSLVAILALGGALVQQTSRGQLPPARPAPGDIGPGDQGATLKAPGADTPAALPSNLQALYKTSAAPSPAPNSPRPAKIAQLPTNSVEFNKDIEISAKEGPWVIFVMSYSGPKAPEYAREFVSELRSVHKKRAFVFNYGAEEKRKEYERVQKLKQDQLDALEKAGLKGTMMPLRVPVVRIDEQTGVLIADNYRTREEALEGVKALRAIKLDEGFADRVQLDVKLLTKDEKDKSGKGDFKLAAYEGALINPFLRAFAAHNPAAKNEEVPTMPEVDVELLRSLNHDEPLSLFQCKKPLTLVIKQYNTQHRVLKGAKESKAFLDLFKVKEVVRDIARENAHNLGEAFRKGGLPETFVLHTKYCSFVTVGGYERVDDPRLVSMQNLLESRFQVEAYRPLELFPRPAPMAVPH